MAYSPYSYDRGNIILTDRDLVILNVLRPRTDAEDGRFAVRETYPAAKAQAREPPPTEEHLRELIAAAKPGDTLKKLLNPHLGEPRNPR
jgi:predicted ribosome quality control (RQC) complex YloA/Tae2 family protein